MPEGNENVQPQGDIAQGGAGNTPPGNNQPAANAGAPSNTPAPGAVNNPGDDARQRGLLADLQKERKARQDFERRYQQLEAQHAEAQRRVQALAGVNVPSPEEQQLDEVRQRVLQMFPVLGKLDDKAIDRLLQTAQHAETFQQTVSLQWENHGRQMVDNLAEEVSTLIGGDLTERQMKALARAYVAEAENDPEFLKRHERGDKTLLKEFAKQWADDWFEPARRRAAADATQSTRRVPSGRDRTVQTTPPKQINFKDPKAVEDAMVEAFRSHGGRFGE